MEKLTDRILGLEKNTNKDNNKYISNKYLTEKKSFNGHSISDKSPRTYEKQPLSIGHSYL